MNVRVFGHLLNYNFLIECFLKKIIMTNEVLIYAIIQSKTTIV